MLSTHPTEGRLRYRSTLALQVTASFFATISRRIDGGSCRYGIPGLLESLLDARVRCRGRAVSGATFGLLVSAFPRRLSLTPSAVPGLIAAWLPLSELQGSVGPLRPAPIGGRPNHGACDLTTRTSTADLPAAAWRCCSSTVVALVNLPISQCAAPY
jgi:hypothetical protein